MGEDKVILEYLKKEYNHCREKNNVLLLLYLGDTEKIINLIEKQQKEINSLKDIEQIHKQDNGLLRQELDMQIEHNKEIDNVLYAKQSMIDELTQNEEKLKIELGKEKEKNKKQFETLCRYEDTLGHYECEVFNELGTVINIDKLAELDEIGIMGKRYISEDIIEKIRKNYLKKALDIESLNMFKGTTEKERDEIKFYRNIAEILKLILKEV